VFPKVGDFGYLQRLKRMKEKILDSIRDLTTPTFHVKLGEGGIREAEFFVQSLQMLFGGQDEALQTPNTLDVLPRLTAARLLDKEEEGVLEAAYVFLRTLEHRLQLADEQQLHQLPAGAEELEELARRMDYAEPDRAAAAGRMLSDLERHRAAVQDAFNDLMAKRFEA
jgi:glutamate-ammonia-ligase adenylyltransferase